MPPGFRVQSVRVRLGFRIESLSFRVWVGSVPTSKVCLVELRTRSKKVLAGTTRLGKESRSQLEDLKAGFTAFEAQELLGRASTRLLYVESINLARGFGGDLCSCFPERN